MAKKLKSLVLSSAIAGSVKVEVGLGLALKLQSMGYRVKFFRPFGNIHAGKPDPEIAVLAKIFGMDKAKFCPNLLESTHFETLKRSNINDMKAKLLATYKSVADSCDFVIIEGNKSVCNLAAYELDDARLALLFDNSPVLAVNTLESDDHIDDVVSQKEFLLQRKATYLGCVFNKIQESWMTRAQKEVIPYLKERGINSFGVIPRDERLTAPTLKEIVDNIDGRIVNGEASSFNLDVLVSSILVGAMSVNAALSYFRRAGPNTLIITGGDRADIILAALEVNAAGVVLTGNLEPDGFILSAAVEKGVPLIVVYEDTFTTASKVESTVAELQLGEQEVCKELVETNCDVNLLMKLLSK